MKILKFNESFNNSYREIGKEYWFEYHCWESHESEDVELWYRSHQRVKILSIEQIGGGDTMDERLRNGEPASYIIEFKDGFKGSCFEDEILDSKEEFVRPDPPKRL